MVEDAITADFVHAIRETLEPWLRAHGFQRQEYHCSPGGRAPECRALYHAPQASLLVEFADGAFALYVGEPGLPFPPPTLLSGTGKQGWYLLHLLVAAQQGRPVYTPRLLKRIAQRKVDPLAFEAELLARWADRILPLFAPGRPAQWRTTFLRTYRGLLSRAR